MQRCQPSLAARVSWIALISVALALPIAAARADDDHDNDGKFQVIPRVFDPADTDLVQSTWLSGIGCPTGARYAKATAANNFNPTKPTGTFTDPACPTGDSKDRENEGLLLVKTGPSDNNAAAVAEIKGLPKNVVLTELGYDIRKPGVNEADPRGSHCGAGAPRFNITTTTGFFFLGCNSPPPTTDTPGLGWQRLRWGGSAPLMAFASSGALTPVTGTVKQLEIVFDEGQDPSGGPDQFGAAILDNIDVNGVLVGRGPGREAH